MNNFRRPRPPFFGLAQKKGGRGPFQGNSNLLHLFVEFKALKTGLLFGSHRYIINEVV